MVKSKSYCPPEGNELKIPAGRNKVQASNPKKYRGKIPRNKPSFDPETETDFQGQCTEWEDYRFDPGTRACDKFYRKMKEL